MWKILNLSIYLFLRASSCDLNIMEFLSLFPYIKTISLDFSVTNIVFTNEIIGVIPLPAAIATYFFLLEGVSKVKNLPAGGKTSIASPGFKTLFTKEENFPSGSSLIATLKSSPTAQEE